MRNVSEKKAVKKIKTNIFCSNKFVSPENSAVYKVMWGNTVYQVRPQMPT